MDRHHAEGFTLVELIVVIAILAILAGVAVPAYSGYVSQANKQADMTLASDIKNALMLAYYEGTLQPGASVVVYFDDDKAVTVDPDGDLGAAAAMTAAFGEGYTSLDLKWDGWKDQMGVAANKVMMDHVNVSNFNSNTLGETLDQVQKVVDAASNLLGGVGGGVNVELSDEVKAYLDQAGVDYNNINESNADAIANAMVFSVAGSISTNENITNEDFFDTWCEYIEDPTNNTLFESNLGMDILSATSAQYAASYSMAQFLDSYTKNNDDPSDDTNFVSQFGGEGKDILDKQVELHGQMLAYLEDEDTLAAYQAVVEHDAMAFLAYMNGVSSSADSMISKEGLNKSNYFNDGAVLGYVNDYMTLSNTLLALDAADVANGALVFTFNGETVSCLPLDY